VTTTVAPSDVTVLLADDDMEILRVLHKSLDKQGYQVHQAHDGAEALESALVVKPNVIILDVMMPELTGWEVCKNLRTREEFENTGIVMLTAIGESLNEMTSPLYGADAHVDKPFDFSEVADAIAAVLLQRCGVVVTTS